jgi:hypothetical protein
MTKQEEMSRKAALAERKIERAGQNLTAEVLRSAFYAALFRSSSNHRPVVEASFESVR